MKEFIDFVDIPHLDEILDYLPVNVTGAEDMYAYIGDITQSIRVNYNYGQYQFAYFGLHLLYMTYIYFTVWKISVMLPQRYADAVVFAKPYHGQKLDFNNIESAFDYSLVAEKELPNILKIIGLEKGQINEIRERVKNRNEMAHASGRLAIKNEGAFHTTGNGILKSVRSIHKKMGWQIRNWFKIFILKFCNNEFEEYGDEDISDIITEKMILDFKLSINDMLVCNGMDLENLIADKPNLEVKINSFKNTLRLYCEKQDYI